MQIPRPRPPTPQTIWTTRIRPETCCTSRRVKTARRAITAGITKARPPSTRMACCIVERWYRATKATPRARTRKDIRAFPRELTRGDAEVEVVSITEGFLEPGRLYSITPRGECGFIFSVANLQ